MGINLRWCNTSDSSVVMCDSLSRDTLITTTSPYGLSVLHPSTFQSGHIIRTVPAIIPLILGCSLNVTHV